MWFNILFISYLSPFRYRKHAFSILNICKRHITTLNYLAKNVLKYVETTLFVQK